MFVIACLYLFILYVIVLRENYQVYSLISYTYLSLPSSIFVSKNIRDVISFL